MALRTKPEAPMTKDQLVAKYSKIVEEKEKEISKIESPRWKTPCSFKATENSSAINLHTVKDVSKLTGILAFLIGAAKDYDEAAKFLDLPKEKFKHQGHTLDDWAEDIKTEIGKIGIAENKQKLIELKAKLESLESPESKEAKALLAIEADLADL